MKKKLIPILLSLIFIFNYTSSLAFNYDEISTNAWAGRPGGNN